MRLVNEERLPDKEQIQFIDLNQAGDFTHSDTVASSRIGIMHGYADRTFRPKGLATRAETAKLLIHLLKLEPRLQEVLS